MIHTFAPALKAKSWLKGKKEIGFRLCEDKDEGEKKAGKNISFFLEDREGWINFVVPKAKSVLRDEDTKIKFFEILKYNQTR